jgi:hypothetical protein
MQAEGFCVALGLGQQRCKGQMHHHYGTDMGVEAV